TATRAFARLSLTVLSWASEPFAPRAAASRPDISLANSAAVLAPADPAAWHPEHDALEPDSMADVAARVAWPAWQVVQPDIPLAEKTLPCGLFWKTSAHSAACGTFAASAAACTLERYRETWSTRCRGL